MRVARFLARTWFGLTEPVGRTRYALSGVGLLALKYVVERAAFVAATGRPYLPANFLDPFWTHREALISGTPGWFAFHDSAGEPQSSLNANG